MESDKQWLAAYLYYVEPWEKLLVHAVAPFVSQIMEEGLADQYFFIRYWEKGPHVRLRFKGNPEVLEKEVKPRLIKHFESYFAENPSERTDPEWLQNAPPEDQWYPNNSVQFMEYEPEVNRYGGPVAITIAEQQFQASSKSILEIISDGVDGWDYDRALGSAIQLHLGFAYGLGMDLKEMQEFFDVVFKNWLPRAYYFFEPDIPQEELDRRREETLKAFEENFNTQKEGLLPFFKTVWEAMNDEQEFEQEWINTWVKDMQEVRDQITRIQIDHALIPPAHRPSPNIKATSQAQQDRWLIYDSYVHMINNRLGIKNRDEGYLGYLITESIKEMLS